jgi:hypothetical protein
MRKIAAAIAAAAAVAASVLGIATVGSISVSGVAAQHAVPGATHIEP